MHRIACVVFLVIASRAAAAALLPNWITHPIPATPALNQAARLEQQAVGYYEAGEYQKALPLAAQALQLRRGNLPASHPAIATSLTWLAAVHIQLGDKYQALPLLREALVICERAFGPSDSEAATCLGNLGESYRALGDHKQALSLHERVLSIRENSILTSSADKAQSLKNLAAAHAGLGRYGRALPLFQRAVTTLDQPFGVKPDDLADALKSLADAYSNLRIHDKAVPLYERALSIQIKALGPDHPDLVVTLHNLAASLLSDGEYDKAQASFERALSLAEKVFGPDSAHVANILGTFGAVHVARKDYSKARAMYSRAGSIHNKRYGEDDVETLTDVLRIADVYLETQSYDKAASAYEQVLPSLMLGPSEGRVGVAIAGLARAYAGLQRRREAIFFGKLAVNMSQKDRPFTEGVEATSLRQRREDRPSPHRPLADTLALEGRVAEALEVVLLLKGDELREYLNEGVSNATIVFSIDEQRWGQRYENVAGTLRASPRARPRASIAEVGAARKTVRQLLSDIASDAQSSATAAAAVPVSSLGSVGALQEFLGRTGAATAVLHYLVTDQRVHVFVTTSQGLSSRHVSVPLSELNSLISTFRRAMATPYRTDFLVSSRKLHELLIAPIAPRLKDVKMLALSTDRRLRYIPFAAIHDGTQYLLERYQLAMLVSAAPQGVPAEVTAKPAIAALGLARSVTITTAGLPPQPFEALPGVRAELQAIVKSTDGAGILPGVIKLDGDFNDRALTDVLTERYPIIHFATHFVFSPGSAVASYLVLGNGTTLSLSALAQGSYDFSGVTLVTASACETAWVKPTADGKEIESFASIVRFKGAHSVLATLWKIDDEGTSQLMPQLYRGLADGMDKVDALRQAQLHFLQDAKYGHPHFWAPFVLMGRWK